MEPLKLKKSPGQKPPRRTQHDSPAPSASEGLHARIAMRALEIHEQRILQGALDRLAEQCGADETEPQGDRERSSAERRYQRRSERHGADGEQSAAQHRALSADGRLDQLR